MLIKKFLIVLILWLSIGLCHAELIVPNQQSSNGSNNFPSSEKGIFPFESGTTQIFPFEEKKFEGMTQVLPPDIAFIFSIDAESPTLLVARWQIAEGHYLYRDKIQFSLQGEGRLGQIQFPPGKIKEDIKYGRVEIYEHQLELKLPIQNTQHLEALTLETTYQGCADKRICYPPIKKTVMVNLPDTATLLPEDNNVLPQQWDDATQFLDAEQAFVFSAEWKESNYLMLRWKIAENYYLYQDKFSFSLQKGGKLGTPQWPISILQKDPLFGDIHIYQQPLLEIKVPIQANDLQKVTLSVNYQGCATAGYCYPPINKLIDLQLNTDSQTMLSEQDQLAHLLASANLLYTIMVFFGLGLLLSLTPCVFPMIPILSSIIVGQGKQVTTYKAFIMSSTYVLAMALTYAIVGVLTGLLGENLQAVFQNPWVLSSFALIFVALSFSMFGFYELQLPNTLQTKLTMMSNRQQGGTLIGVGLMGILSALIVGPCVAAPLVGALIYIGQTGDAMLGGFALFSMSLGMGIPLIIIGISAGHFLPKAGNWMESIKAIFGVMLLAVAIWMLERILPGQITLLLWASLFIVSAVYMGALDNLNAGISGWRKLWKGIGLILLVYGILLMIGAASGHVNPLEPLKNFKLGYQTHTETASKALSSSQFKLIKGISGLEQELAVASAQNKPVMLDFYADWCISCKEMEHFTFNEAEVKETLTHFVLLKADVTPNDEQDKALYKHFGIFGPPAILFFDTHQQEQQAYRVVGFMPANEFQQHLKTVLNKIKGH